MAVLRDVPYQRRSPDKCLSMHLEDASACAIPREEAFRENLMAAEDAAIDEAGDDVHGVDFTRYFCNAETCPTVIGSTAVFRDSHHLTRTFSEQMSEPMWEEIEPLVR